MSNIEILRDGENATVFVSDGLKPRFRRDTRPLREQVADLVTGYNCEWDNPLEKADLIIALVRKKA